MILNPVFDLLKNNDNKKALKKLINIEENLDIPPTFKPFVVKKKHKNSALCSTFLP